ncbi:hypothetical protein BDN72DRAFT_847249 [Pluteus cervinus]|uniref:Uncharacterized protein n=1 Tax=Pluteus cervinus TaxID=181527 RepID=A0ACD3AEM0_9AGAR|nr:hypothetical protein BDN72DRAFT_847249 [Pluteus cervinus]
MHFAPELVSLFFDYIIEDSSPAHMSSRLRTCSLVCQQWRDIAQPLLFSRFTLFRECYSNERLIKSLNSNPILPQYVRAIWMDDTWLDFEDFILLYVVLRGLTHLGILAQWPKAEVDHEEDIRRIFSIALSSPNLTCLFIQDCEFPLYLFYLCPALRELDVVDVWFSHFDEDHGKAILPDSVCSHSPRPQLLRFTIESDTGKMPILRWLMDSECAFDLSALRSFRAFDDSNDPRAQELTLDLVRFVGPSLEHLLIIPPGLYRVGDSADGGNLRSLQIDTDQGDYVNGIPPILNFLERLPHPEKLETFIATCLFNPKHIYEDYIEQGWGKVNSLLTGSSTRFSKFKEMVIKLETVRASTDYQGAESALRRVFPMMQEKGMLTIVKVRPDWRYPTRREPWICYGSENAS